MPRMSKKRRLEWSFFLRQVKVGNTTCDRITYNDLCRGCTHSCKQSFRAVIILCPRYYSKRRKKELQRQVLAYSKTRPVRDGLKQQKNAKAKAAYRQKHESDFIIADAAARYFRENGISKLPSHKALQAEIESLIKEKNSGYNDYRAKREEYRRLQTVKGNIDQILRRERKPVKRQEQER